jgi:hypothetical protein
MQRLLLCSWEAGADFEALIKASRSMAARGDARQAASSGQPGGPLEEHRGAASDQVQQQGQAGAMQEQEDEEEQEEGDVAGLPSRMMALYEATCAAAAAAKAAHEADDAAPFPTNASMSCAEAEVYGLVQQLLASQVWLDAAGRECMSLNAKVAKAWHQRAPHLVKVEPHSHSSSQLQEQQQLLEQMERELQQAQTQEGEVHPGPQGGCTQEGDQIPLDPAQVLAAAQACFGSLQGAGRELLVLGQRLTAAGDHLSLQ